MLVLCLSLGPKIQRFQSGDNFGSFCSFVVWDHIWFTSLVVTSTVCHSDDRSVHSETDAK